LSEKQHAKTCPVNAFRPAINDNSFWTGLAQELN
jgi:hypothetical protein